jgi:hypothetical protein
MLISADRKAHDGHPHRVTPRPAKPLAVARLLRRRRGGDPKNPLLVALDCVVAVIALHLAFTGYLGLPLQFAVALTLLAGVTVFYAVRELFLWQQHLRLAYRRGIRDDASPQRDREAPRV